MKEKQIRGVIARLIRLVQKRPRKKVSKELKGEHYDLKEVFNRVNERYFNGEIELEICWSGSKKRIPRRKVIFGSYSPTEKLIRIQRRLDQAHIPLYFVEFVVYHEILHHVLPPLKKGGRRRIHHCAFGEREKEFAHYEQAQIFRAGWFKN